jgi:hypothetical protein
METIELTDGGILLYDEGFLPADFAERYFVELRDTSAGSRRRRRSATWSPGSPFRGDCLDVLHDPEPQTSEGTSMTAKPKKRKPKEIPA